MVVDIGNQTSRTLLGLESSQRYYFAVTTYNSHANESALTNEARAVPSSYGWGPHPARYPIALSASPQALF